MQGMIEKHRMWTRHDNNVFMSLISFSYIQEKTYHTFQIYHIKMAAIFFCNLIQNNHDQELMLAPTSWSAVVKREHVIQDMGKKMPGLLSNGTSDSFC